MIRRALLSVSDKTGLVELGSALHAHGAELISTGGTAAALEAAGLPVQSVTELTGFPEMLDGRVKTLHPAVHGGILARRDQPGDLAALDRLGIGPIDLVAVNLYPFARTAARVDAAVEELVEQIDIGGPCLVRAAAKNFRHVLVVVEPADYGAVIAALAAGDVPLAFRHRLARKAFQHTAAYDATIATVIGAVDASGAALARRPLSPGLLPPSTLAHLRDLRYGENPHQRAAWFADGSGAGLGAVEILQGKELSYTNLLDLDAAARLALEFDEPAAAVIKHTNPSGVATADDAAAAYVLARDADPLSAFGGIVGLNRPLDAATADAIVETFIEAVVCPSVAPAARPILARKPNMRVVVADTGPYRGEGPAPEYRSILGAVLVQDRDAVVEARIAWPPPGGEEGVRVVTRRRPTAGEWQALRFAWRVCAHVKSNSVIFTAADRTLAVGAGQMSRVDAVNVAVAKAGRALPGSVAASDAFFPFRDGVDAVARAGATAVVQPGGSVRDREVIAAADEHGMAMVFTGRRHFRH